MPDTPSSSAPDPANQRVAYAPRHPTALTIAGSDSGGGAGIQADLKTFCAHGVFGTSVLCAITAQNPDEVRAVESVSPEMIVDQFKALGKYFAVDAAKMGMLGTEEAVRAATDGYCGMPYPPPPLVVDPVMVSSSRARLLDDDAVLAVKLLLPLARLITPNLDEAAVLLGREECGNYGDAAKELYDKFGARVLLKGGHLPPQEPLRDYYYDGRNLHEIAHPWVNYVNVHGTGCTLSAAITANMSKGVPLAEAIENGINYIEEGLTNPLVLGDGDKFLNHQGSEIK